MDNVNKGLSQDILFMEEAIREAQAAEKEGEVPVGAIIVENGVIIGRGRNRIVTDNDPTAHAEMFAIKEATNYKQYCRLNNAVMYVTLEPCSMCAGAIVLARMAKVVIGTTDPKTGACGTLYNILQDNRLNHQCEVVVGVAEEQCKSLLSDFFAAIREKKKP